MATQLSRREVEELRSSLDRAIYRTIGKSDSSLLSTVSYCLTSGYERRKIIDKISSHIDSKKASKLADKILALASELVSSSKSSKRKHEERDDRKEKDSKRSRHEDKKEKDDKERDDRVKEKDDRVKENKNGNGVEAMPLPVTSSETIGSKITGLSADRIKVMMANAQKEIEERKRALTAMKGEKAPVSAAAATAQQIKASLPAKAMPPPAVIKPVLYSKPDASAAQSAEELEKQRKIAELQARIQRKLAGGALAAAGSSGPAPLILDREGRTVDTTGKRVQLTHVAPTLKANIRAKRREEFKAQLSGAATSEPIGDAAWVDPRVTVKPPTRTRRALRFHEPGKFRQQAERLRMKAQLEKLQNEISQIARKTGISSATKLALLASDKTDSDSVPDIEWWDSVILMTPEEREAQCSTSAEQSIHRVAECNTGEDDIVRNLNIHAVTNLVEHPQRLKPPTEPLKPTYMPVFLTKKERKKLRRQSRREAWKEEQERVRLGLEAPPEPKLRISNLMRALGTEAVQDPTAIEAKVREQIAKRQKTHLDANKARALTKDQKREKIDRKIREDTSMGVNVAVYRVRDLFECASAKFKVEVNAQQLHMTGCVVLHRGCCVVVVEGGPKQHAKYKRLMLNRIKWEDDLVKDAEGAEVPNTCTLVWEGATKQRAFGDIKFKVLPTEKQARELFQKHGVEHYWDLAYSGAVLGTAEEEA
ncbi:U4/U6 small nuclear ribonucleoprotein Prp3 [Leguminivora glycinivorella]|uniref:U4/U6 small nuclear ribonucleoprotein Prp3 n=1 Tax=Leguminivora glycinivorella TaxID=1035111 RepID=UPI00200CEC5A|nr:U4/U6 small nuclear ribonucleoprotein Prp3 [Leguminivora glycinivorella]XP_048003201.1 U4/U6 small nuclear ribonucleoprotein Prp3 [Leguminivora glycinivorella]